ncbi:MAG TPA: 16S rRNA (adenine(1518)-N(6)/adenine(1519)-N(6))-dimethyltransferase RsmA [Alphaproteobacteria bacterium]|nr:16S rRNA (adenine(1518)-N(6)/adenine(1519)-N(6))-dimethyltransferase RsmA [Alphaproteobacteria bacterium]
MAERPLPRLPPLREIIAAHELAADKRLGQHFLLDLNLTAKIARAAGDLGGVSVIEIGPGPGGLTRALLDTNAAKVVAVERDLRCIAALQSLLASFEDRLQLVEADALAVDVSTLAPAPRAIVANLPYNIATPLLLGWLARIRDFVSLTLMFQREVAERLVATPRSKAYGRLSVMTQWLTEAGLLFELPARAFTPPPKVDSSVVRLIPRNLGAGEPSFAAMERVVAAAFGQRRKMLRAALKTLLSDPTALLEQAGIDPTARAEELDVDSFKRLARLWSNRNA